MALQSIYQIDLTHWTNMGSYIIKGTGSNFKWGMHVHFEQWVVYRRFLF